MKCDCAACTALAAEYGDDEHLLSLYQRKLLIRGWAGRTSPVEKAYILAHAEWARKAADRLRAMNAERAAHVSNPPAQTWVSLANNPNDIEPMEGTLI